MAECRRKFFRLFTGIPSQVSNQPGHPYHLVDVRPWPLVGSVGALIMTSGLVSIFHRSNIALLYTGVAVIVLTMYQWWRDITREGTYQGMHTGVVAYGLRWGIILFIISEVLFFFSFFWGFFHSRLAPVIEIGAVWPPSAISVFNPFEVPLLNTMVLLASGATVTWAHHALLEGNFSQTVQGLAVTCGLGVYFSILQVIEYCEAPYSIADSIYGAVFFVATGFHGAHVLIGTTFLAVCLVRAYNYHYRASHHFGFEAAAWYWHFVDVVWLFLYISIY